MNHNELLAGLEERFDAVGHDIRIRSTSFDGVSERTVIYCHLCRIEASVTSKNIGGWAVSYDFTNAPDVLAERCVGTISDDVLQARREAIFEAQRAILDAEEAAEQAELAYSAALYAMKAQQSVDA